MKKRKMIALGMVVFSILLTSFSFYFYQVFYGGNILIEKQSVQFLIDKDDNYDSVRNHLYDRDIIQDAVSFSFVSKVLGYQKLVKPGVYQLEPEMTNLEAVRMLRSGAQIPVQITFNNVRLKEELAEKITSNIGLNPNEVLRLLNDDEFLKEYGFNSENASAMFIPDTYEVYWTITAKALFQKMFEQHKKFWNESRKEKAQKLNLSPIEISVLASIVQAESIKAEESPIIAGLYLNRLKRNIALQADPTLVFAVGDFTIQRVLNVHKKVDSPYNTYMYKGLPPGPINMPTISTLDAVLNYQSHNYIYMCAKEDFSGYHRFADNLTQHNKNARLFQNAMNQRKIFR